AGDVQEGDARTGRAARARVGEAVGGRVILMLVEPYYRGHRIHVEAELVDGRWAATVRIRRVLSEEKPYVETVTCRKVTAALAETRAVIWARRWVDIYLSISDRENSFLLSRRSVFGNVRRTTYGQLQSGSLQATRAPEPKAARLIKSPPPSAEAEC